MTKPTFDPDAYELPLARVLLDTLLKKEIISMHTYKVTQRKLDEMEEIEHEHNNTPYSLDV